MKSLVSVVLCLAVLASVACGSSGKKASPADVNATATANIARARTATAEAQAASPGATTAPAATAGGATSPTAAATRPSASPSASPAASGPPSGADAAIKQQLATIEQETAKVRGLQPTGDVPVQVISREQLRANLKQQLNDSYSREQAAQDTLELWLFRLVKDRSLDLYQLQLDLLTEQVLGYYDPATKALYVVSDAAGNGLAPLDQYTMSHEFTHALQDQRYDLQKLQPENNHDADRNAAVSALAEGDSVLSSTQWALQYMSKSDLAEIVNGSGELSSSVLDSAPTYIQKSLLFPYDQGLNFVTTLYGQGKFDAIDRAFTDPPTSTEQIMHPEKYLAADRDEPKDAPLPDISAALGAGWSQSDTDTLGEFDLRELLDENGAKDANQDAAGWGGARYALYQNGDNGVVVMNSVWDTQADADEFAAGLRETLPQASVAANVWNVDGRFIAYTETGGNVYYAAGTDQAAVVAALGALGG